MRRDPSCAARATSLMFNIQQVYFLKVKRTASSFSMIMPLCMLDLDHSHSYYAAKSGITGDLQDSKSCKLDYLEDSSYNSYLFKDILELERIKGAKVLLDLLRLLAFQVGSEVSLTEIGSKLGLDYKTVGRYIDLLEKSFVLFNLRGYSRNLRQEITKKSKYYFYDNGILNAIISNFNSIEIRNDVGTLWENFLVSERIKQITYQPIYTNTYFWRTWEGKEFDWVEEREGKLFAFEFKYTKTVSKNAHSFLATYPDSEVTVVNKSNWLEFVK